MLDVERKVSNVGLRKRGCSTNLLVRGRIHGDGKLIDDLVGSVGNLRVP